MTESLLVSYKDPILRTPAKRVDFDHPGELHPVHLYEALANEMLDKNGIGLAAPQIGIPLQAFVVHSDPVMGFFNPRIIDEGEETISLEEGCLSYPGLFFKVPRPRRIRVRFTEANGESTTEIFTDMTARIILHEMMHLNGILFPSLASKLQLEMSIKKAKKLGHIYTLSGLLGEINEDSEIQV